MTARVVLSCDGEEGVFPCRQAIPVGAILTGKEARVIAKREGWSSELIARPKEGITRYRVEDFCPACTKRRQR
jgi:hypothetical protein